MRVGGVKKKDLLPFALASELPGLLGTARPGADELSLRILRNFAIGLGNCLDPLGCCRSGRVLLGHCGGAGGGGGEVETGLSSVDKMRRGRGSKSGDRRRELIHDGIAGIWKAVRVWCGIVVVVVDRRIAAFVDEVPRFVDHAHLAEKRGALHQMRTRQLDLVNRAGVDAEMWNAVVVSEIIHWYGEKSRPFAILERQAPVNAGWWGKNVSMQSAALARRGARSVVLMRCLPWANVRGWSY